MHSILWQKELESNHLTLVTDAAVLLPSK